MSGKRNASEISSSPTPGASTSNGKEGAEPATKRIHIEPMRLGAVSSQEEMDMKVLRFQNRKLAERLEMRSLMENELRNRIERLEQRQVTDEIVLSLMNKYWTQLEEDIRILLMRVETKSIPEIKTESSQDTKPAIKEEKTEMETDEAAGNEATGSNEVASQDAEVLDMEMETEKKDTPAAKEEKKEPETITSFLATLASCDQTEIDQHMQERCKFSKEAVTRLVAVIAAVQDKSKTVAADIQNRSDIDEAVKAANAELTTENQRLQETINSLQERHQKMTLQFTEQSDKLGAAETKLAEANNLIDDLRFDLNQARQRAQKLEILLEESYTKLKNATLVPGHIFGDGSAGLSSKQLQTLVNELEEHKELANGRLVELERLQEKYQEVVKESEQTKMDLQRLPDSIVMERAPYKNLQSQFSVLYKEAQEMKAQFEETRNLLQQTKGTHLRQMEQMESDELDCQKKLRTEVIQLEDTLSQVRKEYEMLRIEFEQNLAANEQAGPINRELRHLVSSYQSHNTQLKGEINRYRHKLKETQAEVIKLKNEMASHSHGSTSSSSSSSSSGSLDRREASHEKEQLQKQREETSVHHEERRDPRLEKEKDGRKEEKKDGSKEAETIKELRANLKKSQENQKEMKLLLDMYKGAAKEQRDKVQLMTAERRARAEVEELKCRLRHIEDRERMENRKLADEEAIRKIRNLEETIHQLQKKLADRKQEEEALLSEMDVTGQAFEDMQEQNTRLLQQLREKDDANFKLMSERIKCNQIHKLLREEKDVLADQVATLQTQVDAQNQVVRKLEEKERILQNNLSTMDKEITLRQQSLELNRRKALDSSQSTADLKMQLDKITGRIEELQRLVKEKASAVEQENHKFRRAQEESQHLRRKVERYKRMELASSTDEVLMEEIRTYKEQLTCPCCKKGRKDVVLTKCYHVFCFECIKTRYETRQRKCPKCNAGFGANDYHRIWLS
ncbi:E3 ubiquitin-protein ligase BRE1B-like isoform X2 [Patiria miniata]|nr:E3 ubiquitin-protein ligase BRE1B-like isoform X2 [Patiria miniata]